MTSFSTEALEAEQRDEHVLRVALELDPNVWIPTGTLDARALGALVPDHEAGP